jgi:hypothetical protein
MQMHSPTLRAGEKVLLRSHETKPLGEQYPNLRGRKHTALFKIAHYVRFQRPGILSVFTSHPMDIGNDITGDVLQGIRIVR